jgi:flavin reductase (DIM6/NTAB) family NADH-FMN oxidoreductase RutF
MTIHSEHPFQTPPADRDPARRLRGRLVGPVTIVTAGSDGMTASAVLVVEGEPPRVVMAISDSADFRHAVDETRRFVMHVGENEHRALSDRFAEIAPSPGGLFAGLDVIETAWGPRLGGFDTWAGCRLETTLAIGTQILIIGQIEDLHLGEVDDPLIYFRGRYRRLA